MAVPLHVEAEREELRALRRRLEQVQAYCAAMQERAKQQQAQLGVWMKRARTRLNGEPLRA